MKSVLRLFYRFRLVSIALLGVGLFGAAQAQAALFEFTVDGTNYESIDIDAESFEVPLAGRIGGDPAGGGQMSTIPDEDYTGLVVVQVSGSGTTVPGSTNDAFYITESGVARNDSASYQLALDQTVLRFPAPNETLPANQLIRELIVYTFEADDEGETVPPYVPQQSENASYAFVVDLDRAAFWASIGEEPSLNSMHFAMTDINQGAADPGHVDNTGTLEITVYPVQIALPKASNPPPLLVQAVPDPNDRDRIAVTLALTGIEADEVSIELSTGGNCVDIGGVSFKTFFASVTVPIDPDGSATFAATVDNQNLDSSPGSKLIASLTLPGKAPQLSNCVSIQADNSSWVRAQEITLQDFGGETLFGDSASTLDLPGNQRWFKVPIQPGSRLVFRTSAGEVALGRDYDLFVFRDIEQAFVELSGDNDVDGLHQLSAEFAPSIFSPSIFAPSIFSPSIFSPDAYAPSIFSPSIFSPSIFSPSIFSPSIFSPSIFSPSIFSPSIFSPSIFSPSIFSPAEFNPSIFSPSIFSPEDFASATRRTMISASAATGRGPETIVADTWQNTGFYYVLLAGKNAQFNQNQEVLVTVEAEGLTCTGVNPISAVVNGEAGDFESLILWDSGRLDRSQTGNSEEEITALQAGLNALAARAEVAGKVVDLADFSHIQSLQAQADANSECPYAANLVAQAIRDIVVAYRADNPELAYVVLAGGDRQIPFFRYPDDALIGPEENYDPPMADGTQSQSALRLNYALGQDEYGSDIRLLLGPTQFPVPDLAVGRLVETAAEMTTVIDAYLGTANGVVDTPTSTLVSGYDFLTDAANVVQAELVAGTDDARNDTLITAADISPADPRSWTADDLRRELFETREDIIFLAGHFSANSALAADYSTSALATELDNSSIDLTNVLVFSAGCHSGYNIVNEHAVDLLTEPRDWTQAFAAKGATLIAGTGYQYGDTEFVEYGERLYGEFARELRTGSGPVAIGEALVAAKQRYLAETPDVRGLHRKSVVISTLFGLPMLKIDMPGERITAGNGPSSIITSPVVGAPGGALGLEKADLNLDFGGRLTTETVALANLAGGSLTATYLIGPDGVVTNPAEPAIPLSTTNVSVAGTALRGVGFRGGDWTERRVVPLTGAPTTELRGAHVAFSSTLNFPFQLAQPNFIGALVGGDTLLHVTPAQHRVDAIGDTQATLREFSNMQFELFYSNNTQTYGGNRPALSTAPSLSNVRALVDGDDVIFQAKVVGDPAAGIQNVWVTFTDNGNPAGSGQWSSIDLEQNADESTEWQARLPGAFAQFERLEFVVQAVNGVGLVSLDDNFGAYFGVSGTDEDTAPDGTPLNRLRSRISSFFVVNEEALVFGQTARLTATLTDDQDNPIEDANLFFSIGAAGQIGRTNEQGVAEVDLSLNLIPGEYEPQVRFDGNPVYESSLRFNFLEVNKADTQFEVTTAEPVVEDDGVETGFVALLTDQNGAAVPQRTVYITISGPEGDRTLPIITDFLGRASLGKQPLDEGSYTITARFLGAIPGVEAEQTDTSYGAAISAATALVIGANEPLIDAPLSCHVHKNIWRPWRSTVTVGFEPRTKRRDLPAFTELFISDHPDRRAFSAVPNRWGRYKQRTGKLKLYTGFRTFFTKYIGVKDSDGNRSERVVCN